MNDQQFVNSYIRILNETINEAISKNLVMQAQLEVSKQNGNRIAELELKIKELTNLSSDNNALQSQLDHLKSQLEQSNFQLNNKNSHVETFKRELVDARNSYKNVTAQHQIEIAEIKTEHEKKVDSLNAEIELLKTEIEELKSRKRKKEKKSALNTVEPGFIPVENDLISVSETF